MKSIILAGCLAVIAGIVSAVTLDADIQSPGEPHVLGPVFVGNTPYITLRVYDNDVAATMSNTWSMVFSYRPKATSTNDAVKIQGSWSTASQCLFFSTNVFSHAGDYYFSIAGTNTSGVIQTFARGALKIEYDPSIVAP